MNSRSKPPGGTGNSGATKPRRSLKKGASANKTALLVSKPDPQVREIPAPGSDGITWTPTRPSRHSDDPFEPFEPYHAPVNVSDLLNDMSAFIQRHVTLTQEQADAIALWVIFAHAHRHARTSPILGITAPTMRSGKTTLLRVVGSLVPRAMSTSNITPAAMYRMADKFEPTLLIDEGDSFIGMNESYRNILNSGHSRSGATKILCDGQNWEPKIFRTWCPKAIATIGELPDTVADRSVVIRLKRKLATDHVEEFGRDSEATARLLRAKAARWVIDNKEKIHD